MYRIANWHLVKSSCTLPRSLHPHLDPVNSFARRDEAQVAVLAAEGEVRGPRLRHPDVFNSPLGESRTAATAACGVDAVLGVEACA